LLDILIEDRGTGALLKPLTRRGRQWVEQHVDSERESEGVKVIDSADAAPLAAAAKGDGMTVRIDDLS
jgi:hypothetical protein